MQDNVKKRQKNKFVHICKKGNELFDIDILNIRQLGFACVSLKDLLMKEKPCVLYFDYLSSDNN